MAPARATERVDAREPEPDVAAHGGEARLVDRAVHRVALDQVRRSSLSDDRRVTSLEGP